MERRVEGLEPGSIHQTAHREPLGGDERVPAGWREHPSPSQDPLAGLIGERRAREGEYAIVVIT